MRDDESLPDVEWITLRCPVCKKQIRAIKDDSDLPESVIVEACCPQCPCDGFEEILYYREDGTQILEG